MVDIHAKVLAAFQVECKEHLESIRSLVSELGAEECLDRQQRIEDAFRLAHTLKGGARVCDLKQAELLSHRLEHVFECLQHGKLQPGDNVVATIQLILDGVEDCLSAIERKESLPDIDELLQRVDRCVTPSDAAANSPPPPSDSIALDRRLLESFRREYARNAEQLRTTVRSFCGPDTGQRDRDLQEAARLAHNLMASAQAAGLVDIEPLAKRLESTIAGLAAGMVEPAPTIADSLQALLGDIECRVIHVSPAVVTTSGNTIPAVPEESTATHESADDVADETSDARRVAVADDSAGKPPAPVGHGAVRSAPAGDTVRVAANTLDQLLLISRQLATECTRQRDVGRELRELKRMVQRLLTFRDAFRCSAGDSLHNVSQHSHIPALLHHLELVDEQILSVARQVRHLDRRHQQNTWMFSSRVGRLRKGIQQARMTPVDDCLQGFRKMVRDLAKEQEKQVELEIRGGNVCADRLVLQALRDPLMHMLRNCVIHGIETSAARVAAGKPDTGRIMLRFETLGNRLTVEVEDDGRGLNLNHIRQLALRNKLVRDDDRTGQSLDSLAQLIFRSGFTTYGGVTEVAGRGMGLSVVHDTVARLQGDVNVAAPNGRGALFRINVPLSVATHRLLLVRCGQQVFGLPLHAIDRLLRYHPAELATVESKPVLTYQDRPLALVALHRLLGLEERTPATAGELRCAAILRIGNRRAAVDIDGILSERDALIHDLDEGAAKAPFAGAIVLDNGHVALVINPSELFTQATTCRTTSTTTVAVPESEPTTPRVLVVDDSFTTRTLEKSILEAHGYEVAIAVDGVEALSQLRRNDIDLVISDIEMPRMDGFSLLKEMKHDQRLADLPVILVTSRNQPEDEQRGLALGANAYIVKRKFDHQELLGTIQQMLQADDASRRMPQPLPI